MNNNKSISRAASENESMAKNPWTSLVDLVIFLGVMFFVRTIYIESLDFWGNALFKSISTVGTATALLYLRKQSWKDIGLIKPKNFGRVILIIAAALAATILVIILFQLFLADLFPTSGETAAAANTRNTEKSVMMIAYILSVIWIESFLEELQDRGFSLNRFESLLSNKTFSTVLAVLIQAIIFGFRHSYDLSERSITTGLIGLVFGAVYVLSGRNLWPLIIAHCILNTSSMLDRL